MNKPQSPRRPRGRGPKRNNKGSGSGRGDNRAKGNPRQSLEKYKTMARDALQSGDRVLAEYYFQFADHYQRVCNERFGVSLDDDTDHDDESVDQEEQQGQSRRPQQRSRSQRAEDAVAMERVERPRPTEQQERSDVPVSTAEGKEPEAQVDDETKKTTAARPNGRRRPAPRKSASPDENRQVAADALTSAPAEDTPKPRPGRRRKIVAETVDGAPE